ncbi:Bax inhibitor-1/YccA family protein [bacterium]|nr:Bax inhibitor-1/YccA family protein [bacterium]
MRNVREMAWSQSDTTERDFVTKVFAWMAFALILTGVVAAVTAETALGESIARSRGLFFGLIIGELALVIALSAGIRSMSASTATLLFIVYSGVNGLTLSVVFLFFTQASIASTFLVTAATFGAMALYGASTKRDLTAVGSLCMMGLIGVVIASIVNIFFHNEAIYWAVTYIGILVFVGLTAYDTQKLKAMAAAGATSREAGEKLAILGALALYLDFINLFLLLLRLMGRRR